jgi:hypothetical protein
MSHTVKVWLWAVAVATPPPPTATAAGAIRHLFNCALLVLGHPGLEVPKWHSAVDLDA